MQRAISDILFNKDVRICVLFYIPCTCTCKYMNSIYVITKNTCGIRYLKDVVAASQSCLFYAKTPLLELDKIATKLIMIFETQRKARQSQCDE